MMVDTVYRTASIKPEYRDMLQNGLDFDTCEDCSNKNYEAEIMDIVYYSRYKKALCSCCVDNRDGWKWEGKKDFSLERKLEEITANLSPGKRR